MGCRTRSRSWSWSRSRSRKSWRPYRRVRAGPARVQSADAVAQRRPPPSGWRVFAAPSSTTIRSPMLICLTTCVRPPSRGRRPERSEASCARQVDEAEPGSYAEPAPQEPAELPREPLDPPAVRLARCLIAPPQRPSQAITTPSARRRRRRGPSPRRRTRQPRRCARHGPPSKRPFRSDALCRCSRCRRRCHRRRPRGAYRTRPRRTCSAPSLLVSAPDRDRAPRSRACSRACRRGPAAAGLHRCAAGAGRACPDAVCVVGWAGGTRRRRPVCRAAIANPVQ